MKKYEIQWTEKKEWNPGYIFLIGYKKIKVYSSGYRRYSKLIYTKGMSQQMEKYPENWDFENGGF
jgi:hypothetical protein